MKKVIALILAMMMLASLAACGNHSDNKQPNTNSNTSQTEENHKEEIKNASPTEIEAAIAKALGDGYLATVDVPEDEIQTSALGGLDMEKVDGYIIKQAVIPSVDLDTVVIVNCKAGYADEAVKCLNESYANTISYIRQYPFGVAKVEGARLYKIGDTVIYVIAGASAEEGSSAEEEAKLAADEYDKIDAAIKEVCGILPENLAVIPEDSGNTGGLFADDDMPVVGG